MRALSAVTGERGRPASRIPDQGTEVRPKSGKEHRREGRESRRAARTPRVATDALQRVGEGSVGLVRAGRWRAPRALFKMVPVARLANWIKNNVVVSARAKPAAQKGSQRPGR